MFTTNTSKLKTSSRLSTVFPPVNLRIPAPLSSSRRNGVFLFTVNTTFQILVFSLYSSYISPVHSFVECRTSIHLFVVTFIVPNILFSTRMCSSFIIIITLSAAELLGEDKHKVEHKHSWRPRIEPKAAKSATAPSSTYLQHWFIGFWKVRMLICIDIKGH